MVEILIAAAAAAIVVGLVGVILGFFLGFSGEAFKVEVDEREEAICGVLPGNNCGACGYPGCDGVAAAIVKGDAPVNACPVNTAENAAKIAGSMGVDAVESVKKVAFVKCAGDCESTTNEGLGIRDEARNTAIPIPQL